MSQSNSTTIAKAGEIVIKETRRGIEFHAFNEQRKRVLHVGTLIGRTYEKVQPILMKPEPSFSLTQAEYSAVLSSGAEFVRIVLPDKRGSYAIDVQSFGRYGEKYFNVFYGPQLRVPLIRFAFTSRVSKRNKVTDNPVLERPGPIAPREKQLDFTRLLDR